MCANAHHDEESASRLRASFAQLGDRDGGRAPGLEGPELARLLRGFIWAVVEEIDGSSGQGDQESPDGEESLKDYYRRLDPLGPRALQVSALAKRVTPLATEAVRLPVETKAVDVGCGWGTETLLLGALGLEATGIDLRTARLDGALRRAPEWARALGFSPERVSFVAQDVLRYIREGGFEGVELVHIQDALSHVHPAEELLRLAGGQLRSGSRVVILESNTANPIVRLRHLREWRGTRYRVADDRFDPATGVSVPYAQERTFSPHELARMLDGSGFDVVRLDFGGYIWWDAVPANVLRASWASRAADGFDGLLRRVPGARRIGAYYAMVAQRR